MMLMFGKPGEWSLHSWFCQLRTKLFLFEFLDEREATIEAYTSPSSEAGEEIVRV